MTPKLADHLPEFARFLQNLTEDVHSKKITSWKAFAVAIKRFYTPEMMQKIDCVAPGWIDMASYQQGITLSHVTSVFVTLYGLPEYQQATETQRSILEWAILFHDITKVPVKDGHDYVHGFKSAAVAAKALSKLGFSMQDTATDSAINTWYELAYNATVYNEDYAETIQDMRKLHQIVEGLQQIHTEDAYAIVLSILLHIAIVTDPEYPILAPISEANTKRYITPDVLPIIKTLYLADGSGWLLFEEDISIDIKRQEFTRNTFDAIKFKNLEI